MLIFNSTPYFKRFVLMAAFIVLNLSLFSQKSKAIHIQPNHVLITIDTMYFGSSDTLIVLPDSVKYIITRTFKKGVRFLESYYKSLFIKDTAIKNTMANESFERSVSYFEPYEGKIIREISVKQVDPIGGSVKDTLKKANSKWDNSLNRTNLGSRKFIIKRNIRIEPNDEIVPTLISDNERIIRNLPYIEDAKIFIIPDTIFIDSVDVIVVTKDKFPIGFTGSITNQKQFTMLPYNKNFIGLGHTLQPELYYNDYYPNAYGYGGEYLIPNILHSFINMKFEFENSYAQEYYKISISKPFISNDIKYGGGLSYFRLSSIKNGFIYQPDTTILTRNVFAKDDYNFWLGRSFKISKKDFKNQINISIRYHVERYMSHPTVRKDTNLVFHDNNMLLGRLSFIQKEHYKTSRLFSYGVTEDVPYGYSFSVFSGLQINSYFKRPYIGAYANWTRHFSKIGYFAYEVAGGTFFRHEEPEDMKLGSKVTYFSPYVKYGKIGVRHSLIPVISTLINPLYLEAENFGKKIRQLNNDEIYGKSIMVVRYEPYIYSHFGIKNFKLAISVFSDIGYISKDSYWQGPWENYGAYGFGLHLRNERLTIPTLTVQLAYYPNINSTIDPFHGLVRFSDRRLFDETIIGEPKLYHDF